MGNFEKLVVLAVLFLSAIVLAVSLNEDAGEVEAADPISAAQERVGQERSTPAPDLASRDADRSAPAGLQFEEREPRVPSEPATAPKTSYLLHAETTPTPPAAETTGPPRILKATGLEPTASPDTMAYTVTAGDTWSGLAMRFYGDARYTTNLHRANDEQVALQVGEEILVPVFDFLQGVERPPLAPEDRAPALDPGVARTAQAGSTAAGPAPEVGEVYVVQKGDSLSGIAQRAYGNGHNWKPIFEANRNVMRTPDWLQVGMKLRIPPPDRVVSAPPVDPDKPRVR